MNFNKEIIYLAGFMGAGKSTIGPILANTLAWNFADLDKIIEAREKMKVREIFEKKGEKYFRKVETETLEELSKNNNYVVSLGGGTITFHHNIKIMKETGIIILLTASIESIYKRLRFKTDRPMFKTDNEEPLDEKEFMNKIERMLDSRMEFYNQADLKIDADKKSVGKTVDYIAKIISSNKNKII